MAQYKEDLMEHGRLPLGRAFTPSKQQLLIREMILQLKRGYLEVDYFRKRYAVDITKQWANEFQGHADNGMLTFDDSRVELTRKGFLHADALLPVFFEAENQGVRYT